MRKIFFAGAFCWLSVMSQARAQQSTCQQLTSLKLANNVVVVSATEVAGETVRCKVSGTIDQTSGFEVNLPANWNHKLLVVGSGGVNDAANFSCQEP